MRSYYLRARALLALALLITFGGAFANSGAGARVTVGSTLLSIPVPTGFVHAEDPDLIEFAQRFVPGSNRLLALMVTPDDLRAWRAGKEPGFQRYFALQAPKSAEHLQVGQRDFDRVRANLRSRFGAVMDRALPKVNAELEKNLRDREVSATLNSASLDGIISDESDALVQMVTSSFSVGASGTPATHKQRVGLATMLMRGKIVFAYAYAQAADDAWVRKEIASLVTRVRAANR